MRKQTIGLAGALMLWRYQHADRLWCPRSGTGIFISRTGSADDACGRCRAGALFCLFLSAYRNLQTADIAPDDAVTAQAGALFDVTDSSVIYGKNIYDQMYPASITKVMTAIIAIEEGNLSDAVTANDDVVIHEAGASMAGIKPGDTFTLEQLLYGLMIPSGNDAANAIADHIAGSTDAFVEKMNAKAKDSVRPTRILSMQMVCTAPTTIQRHMIFHLIFNEALKLPLFCEIINARLIR